MSTTQGKCHQQKDEFLYTYVTTKHMMLKKMRAQENLLSRKTAKHSDNSNAVYQKASYDTKGVGVKMQDIDKQHKYVKVKPGRRPAMPYILWLIVGDGRRPIRHSAPEFRKRKGVQDARRTAR